MSNENTEYLPEAAISGVGIISPVGCNTNEILESLRSGRDAIAQARKIDVSAFSSKLCAEVGDFDYASKMSPEELSEYTDPFLRMAICAARMAIADAGENIAKAERLGMVIASCNAGLQSREAEYINRYVDSSFTFNHSTCAQSEFYALAKVLAKCLNAKGECFMINTACSGSTAAIGLAQSLIESGRCDAVIAGGADAMVLANYAGFHALKVVSPEKIAPFSNPVGMNIGEGAAFWVLERSDIARKRNAKIYGRVVGHATSADAHHPTQPDPRGDGAYRTMAGALKDSGLKLSDIACINAHGSGTNANDKAEAKAIEKFCEGAKIPVTSTKSYAGHCMGATGIIEATCQLVAMNNSFIPPTLRFGEPRIGCANIDVANKIIEKDYGCFLSANYAFAGSNAAIVVAKPDFPLPQKSKKKIGKIVISGVACASPLGLDIDAQVEALRNGERAVKKISRFESERYAGMVEIPNPRALDRRVDFSGMNRISIYATLAAKKALDDAKLQIRRDMSENAGMVVAVCRGSDESAHMKAVAENEDRRGDITCFSNITANSTAGWVSKALELKGANTTLTSGIDAGVQSIEYAAKVVAEGRAKCCLAMSADEIYEQQLHGYEKIGFLRLDEAKTTFEMRQSENAFETILAEGAAALLVESEESALERQARIYAEILACATTMDACDFLSPDIDGDALERATNIALERANLKASDIDLILWSPRGNAQDTKIAHLMSENFAQTPTICSTFNTGCAEASAGLMNIAFALRALSDDKGLWTQLGVKNLTAPDNNLRPQKILCLATSHTANAHAIILSTR